VIGVPEGEDEEEGEEHERGLSGTFLVLVATAVLFLNTVSGAESSEFESDSWPQLGIELMGLPLLVTFFFVNAGTWLRRPMAQGIDS
jgi:hypothetical protein